MNSTLRYLPMMVGRLMLSLRKAADKPDVGWSLASTTHASDGGHPRYTMTRPHEMQFAPISEGTGLPTEEDISLATISSTKPIPVS